MLGKALRPLLGASQHDGVLAQSSSKVKGGSHRADLMFSWRFKSLLFLIFETPNIVHCFISFLLFLTSMHFPSIALSDKPASHALVCQSYPAVCDSVDCSPPGSSVHGIPQARHWSALPFLSSGEIEPRSPALQADSLPPEIPGKPKLLDIKKCLCPRSPPFPWK